MRRPALSLRGRPRLNGAVGSRELLSLLCEELARSLHASDCLVSRWDPERSITEGVAGFTGVPERWTLFAGEYQLDRYPITRSVLGNGHPYTTWVGDPEGDPAEQALLNSLGLTAGLLLRLDAPGAPYLVEVWSDSRTELFSRRQRRRASALVRAASRRLPAAIGRDDVREREFLRAAEDARAIGVADDRLPVMATAVGEAMLLAEPALDELRLVALVHDVGKTAIPPGLRSKLGPLTPVEWAIVQRHTLVGQRMIARMPYLAGAVSGAGAIRERWDGGGYPAGLAREQTPLAARIVAACSAYYAIRSDRDHRGARGHEDAMAELERGAGTQFDPDVVQAMWATVGADGPRSTVRLRAGAI
jgi:hypothetical protein